MNDENIEVDLSPGDVESATRVWHISFQVRSGNVALWWNKHERVKPILKKLIWTKQTKDRVGQQNNERESNEVQRPNTVFARLTDPDSNGNRTEWNPIRSVIKIGRPRSGSPICLSRVWLQTELDDTKSYYQLIIKITN